jgi:hypothetical protein
MDGKWIGPFSILYDLDGKAEQFKPFSTAVGVIPLQTLLIKKW